MKHTIATWTLALFAFAASTAFAQHGHGGGMGNSGSSGGGFGHGHSTLSGSNGSMNSGKSSASIGQKLDSHPKLASKLQSLLPAGTDLKTAADGFKNFGQFVAAVHVSHNLGIPFDQLKAKMTGPNAESLGKAITDLNPAADAKLEVKKAEKQAKADENS
jgi:hypothetical protein